MDILKLFEALETIKIGSLSLAVILSAALVFFVCLISGKIILKIADRALERSKFEKGLRGFVVSSLKIAVWFLIIMITADSLGIPVTSLVTLLGVAGLALSLSVQNQLSNLFSGMTLLGVKPFLVGESVEISGVSGTVREIGLFNTTLSAADNSLIMIPNSEITSSRITNFSREENRRLELKFCVSDDSSDERVKAAILGAVSDEPQILPDPAPFVAMDSRTEKGIEYVVRVWTKNADYLNVSFALKESVRSAFGRDGIEPGRGRLDVRVTRDS